jgi:hypothetical protein
MTRKYDYKVFPETTKARVLLALAFAGGLLVMAGYFALFILRPYGAWWDEIEVTYVNETNETIAIYVNDDLDVTVPAGEQTTVGYRKLEWWWNAELEVRDLQGNLISADRYDKDDLKRLDYRIVIDD